MKESRSITKSERCHVKKKVEKNRKSSINTRGPFYHVVVVTGNVDTLTNERLCQEGFAQGIPEMRGIKRVFTASPRAFFSR